MVWSGMLLPMKRPSPERTVLKVSQAAPEGETVLATGFSDVEVWGRHGGLAAMVARGILIARVASSLVMLGAAGLLALSLAQILWRALPTSDFLEWGFSCLLLAGVSLFIHRFHIRRALAFDIACRGMSATTFALTSKAVYIVSDGTSVGVVRHPLSNFRSIEIRLPYASDHADILFVGDRDTVLLPAVPRHREFTRHLGVPA